VIRVFLIAGSAGARTELRGRLKPYGVNVVGEAAGIEGVGVQLSDTGADALLIDGANASMDSVIETLTEADLAPEIPTVLLVDEMGDGQMARALCAGVRGVLPRQGRAEQIAAALSSAKVGLVTLLPQEISAVAPVSSSLTPDVIDAADTLTPREREVLQMLAGGLANKEIAARLNISDHTAKFHVAAILGKLGAATRTEAVTIGIRRGLVLL
jgi:two-component system, NarL family, response regulator YdfI